MEIAEPLVKAFLDESVEGLRIPQPIMTRVLEIDNENVLGRHPRVEERLPV